MKRILETLLCWCLVIITAYLTVAMFTYRYRHPWLTETQLTLQVFDAIRFKK